MTTDWLSLYRAVWLLDFEFSQPPGERPKVVCMVAREFHSGEIVRMSMAALASCQRPPFDIGDDSLFVAYFSSAEWSCFLSLNWQLPARVLDLWVEFRALLNGTTPPAGWSLLGCLSHFGLDSIAATEKQEMRELAMSGGPFTGEQMADLLDYCQTDVDALARLLPAMSPEIDFPRALLRGRYMAAVARMEHNGLPIDVDTLTLFRQSWDNIKTGLVAEVDSTFGVYEGLTFKESRFADFLIREGIPWPRLDSGKLALDDDTFRQQARSYPRISPLRELRHSLSEMKLESLAVGSDGRNRCMLRPFTSRSGRNQPSNTQFIFGPSVWLRGLIRPERGRAIAYIDWSQQELGIAAALSGDLGLVQAYRSGDPYLEFAKMAGAVPASATKQSHPAERSVFKVCMLATQYGMGEQGLADKLAKPVSFARNLLRTHRETFPTFWRWSQSQVDHAMLAGRLSTVFGWPIRTVGDDNPRSLGNFSMQANGSEMLRLTCCVATERGICVCCPVHDAILIEGPAAEIDYIVAETQGIMREASRIILAGFELESDAKIVRWPHRYQDADRGLAMWQTVLKLGRESVRVVPPCDPPADVRSVPVVTRPGRAVPNCVPVVPPAPSI